MWKQRQSKILTAIFCVLLLVSVAACHEKEVDSGETISSAVMEPTPLSKQAYIAKVDGLRSAMERFLNVNSALLLTLQEANSSVDEILALVEEIRLTQNGFLEAAKWVPPPGYEDAHTALADACLEFADWIDVFCGYMQDLFLAEESPEAELEETENRLIEAAETLLNAVDVVDALAR